MAKIVFILISFSLIVACTQTDRNTPNEEKNIETNKFEIDLTDFTAFDLEPFGIAAIIYLPKENNIPTITHELDGFQWNLIGNDEFKIDIKDWGDNSFDEYLNTLEIQTKPTFQYLNKSTNSAFYRTEDGNGNDLFYFISFYTIGEINYVFESTKKGVLEKDITLLKNSLLSIQPK